MNPTNSVTFSLSDSLNWRKGSYTFDNHLVPDIGWEYFRLQPICPLKLEYPQTRERAQGDRKNVCVFLSVCVYKYI